MAAVAFLLAATEGMAGVAGSPHDFSATGPWTQSLALTPAGKCSACHVPHRQVYPKLWIRNLSGYSNATGTGRLDIRDGVPRSEPNFLEGTTVQCYDCHDNHTTQQFEFPNVPDINNFTSTHRPQNILFGFRKNSLGNMTEYDAGPQPGKTTPGYYETDPPGNSVNFGVNLTAPLSQTGGHYYQNDPTGITNDNVEAGDKLACSICHDPHAWNRDWQAFIRTVWPFGSSVPLRLPTAVQASRNMANESTPTGNRSDVGSRVICTACHGNSDTVQPVFFSEIVASYRNNLQIARPPASVGEHASGSAVACTSCHAHNSIGANCTACHGYPPSDTAAISYPVAPNRFVPSPNPGAGDSHPRHYGAKSGQGANSFSVYSFGCEVCHYGSAGAGSGLGRHTDARISVLLQGVWTRQPNGGGGVWDNTNYFNQSGPKTATGELDNSNNVTTGWGSGARYGGNSCQNVYCHSAGRVQSSMALDCTVEYRQPAWNSGALHCNDCHGFGTDNATAGGIYFGMPGYPSGPAGSATANTHKQHVDAGFGCSACHAATVTGAAAGRSIAGTVPSLHVNGLRDVAFGSGASGTYDNAAKSCAVSCHGADRPVWGGVLANGCFSCHSGAEQIYKPRVDYGAAGTANPVDNNEYLHSGHGRSGSGYPVSGNPPAGFSNYTTAPEACYVCHSRAAAHTTKSANDPFRLGSAADNTLGGLGTFTGQWADNTDALCLGCHGDAAQRAGHDNAAKGAGTVNAQVHARGVTGTKYNWPGPNYPWKCVDCHDPHGDGRSGAERLMMLRSGINAPIDNNDAGAGSDGKSITRRTDGNVRPVTFNSVSGFAAGSYAQPGNGTGGTWGPCEVCHTQTSAYSRTLDNTSSHASRTNRCTTCHPHARGFAPSACEGCHGGLDGLQPPSGNAPVVTRYWQGSGHGKFTTGAPARAIVCEDCHDTGYLTGNSHKTDGTVAGAPPLNINTETWPGKPAQTADTSPNSNTSHLRTEFIQTSATSRADVARKFDNYCAAACHARDYHRHQKPTGPLPQDVMRFGDPGSGTTGDPKQYNWLPLATYATDFYRSQSPWVDSDMRVSGLPDNTNYGLCVSCHDPHGTATTDTKGSGALATNAMTRWNWKTDAGTFCARACHTSRPAP